MFFILLLFPGPQDTSEAKENSGKVHMTSSASTNAMLALTEACRRLREEQICILPFSQENKGVSCIVILKWVEVNRPV